MTAPVGETQVPEATRPSTTAQQVAAQLRAAGVPSPETDARWLIEHARRTGKDLEPMIVRRVAREPLQLILGRWRFRDVEVACRPGVFVPRPETEIVAGLAVAAARAAGRHPLVLEPCTGTGAIAMALVAEVPGAHVIATDRSVAAVQLARDNAAGRFEVLHGDLFSPLAPRLLGKADVVVANPPYLPAADAVRWAPEVRDHEPRAALVGGDDGHEIVQRMLCEAGDWMTAGGVLVLEIDERRGPEVSRAATALGWVDVQVHPDLAGRDRVLVARRSAGSRS